MKDITKLPAQLWLQAGSGAGVATLSGNRTLNGESAHFQILTPSGANRDVTLPNLGTTATGNGQWFVIRNAGSTYNLVVKDSGGSTVATLPPGAFQWFVSARVSGTNAWYQSFSDLALMGAVALTGRLTTTDGVASGDARIVGGNVHTKTATTTVSNTTTETTIGSHALAANVIKAGTTVRIRGSLRVTGVNATPTVTLKIKLGSTAIMTTTTLSMIANDIAVFDADITGTEAAGASTTVHASARVTASQSGTPVSAGAVPAPIASVATNGALTVSATVTWSAAHASNVLVGQQFSVDVVG